MTNNQDPVVLELAPLPREQIGPFLLLGLDKDAGQEQIEANWAKRVIWARKQQTRLALEDINWSREVLNDAGRRVRADGTSLNPDTIAGTARRLARRYSGLDGTPLWQPLERDQPTTAHLPTLPGPDPEEVRGQIPSPVLPCEVPALARMLKNWVGICPDPWDYTGPVPKDPPA
jgi:hypothetical protein